MECSKVCFQPGLAPNPTGVAPDYRSYNYFFLAVTQLWKSKLLAVEKPTLSSPLYILSWFLQSGEVRESQGKSRWSGEVREFKSTMVRKLTKMQKKTELLHARCKQQFKIFSARFARRLFILLLFHLFCRPCF